MRIHRQAVWAMGFLMAAFLAAIAPACFAQDAPPASQLQATLAELHGKARQARTEGRFADVEALRLERLALLASADGTDAKSPWATGAKALTTADDQIKAMQYDKACATLAEAWAPFQKPARGEAVLGDIALKLFEATQAAKAVYPDFNAISADQLRTSLRLAADADPCQVEAIVADAFLAAPDPAEAFEPAADRPSLQARARLLRDISPADDSDSRPLPWHAPAEFLKAAGNSFVLGDLDYYHRFLDPRRRLRGVDGDGSPVHVVMGGSLLVVERDKDGAKRLSVADYDPAEGRWVRMTPRILRVQPPAFKPVAWRLDEAKLNADLRGIMDDAIAERQTLLKRRLLVAAEGLKGSIRVKADIRKILAAMKEPPKNREPLKLEEVCQFVNQGFGNYAFQNPDEAKKVADSQQQVQKVAEDWSQFKARLEALQAAIGNTTVPTSIEPGKAATALAEFLAAIGAESADARELAEATENMNAEDDAKADTKAKPGKKTLAKNGDAASPIQLSGQELRLKMSRQKEQYDLLALFQLMKGVQRGAIEQPLMNVPPAPPPDAAPPSREEQARAAARLRLAEALDKYDTVLAQATREAAKADGSEAPATKTFSLTLDELLSVGSAVREMNTALRTLTNDSDQTRFLGKFADTIEAVAQPAAYEAEMQRFCTKTNRQASWQLGQATWRVYDFPASTPADKVADMIDHCQRVAFAAADFDAVMAQAEDNLPPAGAEVPLRSGCTTPLRNRLVQDRNKKLGLQFLSTLTDPCTVLFLDIDRAATGEAPLANLDDGRGGSAFWLELDGERLKTAVVAEKGTKPGLVVDFAGPLGHVPLGAAADSFADVRFMTDRRDTRVVRDRSGKTSPLEAHFYAMTSSEGKALTARTVNYAIQDWLDLDRTIVNALLPDMMIYAPSLPAWQVYRREFMRPAPDDGWMWPAARRTFAPGQP